MKQYLGLCINSGIILCLCPANERQCYIVLLYLIGWVHTQNDPCWLMLHLSLNTLRLRPNGWYFEDNIFNCIFCMKNNILIQISLKYVLVDSTDYKTSHHWFRYFKLLGAITWTNCDQDPQCQLSWCHYASMSELIWSWTKYFIAFENKNVLHISWQCVPLDIRIHFFSLKVSLTIDHFWYGFNYGW